MIDLEKHFAVFDRLPRRQGYEGAIEASQAVVGHLDELTSKLAMATLTEPTKVGPGNPTVRMLGALAQMWKDPKLNGVLPQKPSSLGQMLVMGGLGSLAGYAGGKLIDKAVPNDAVKASRAGAILGGLAGVSPGLASALLNYHANRPVWTTSFWDTKLGSFGVNPYSSMSIDVNAFQKGIWDNDRYCDVPVNVRAAASGLITGAANLPGKYRNSPFVTPFDIARVAVGMGSGLASGWLVGKTLGALFGTGAKTQQLLQNTGMAAGALKTVIPLAYGQEPYAY